MADEQTLQTNLPNSFEDWMLFIPVDISWPEMLIVMQWGKKKIHFPGGSVDNQLEESNHLDSEACRKKSAMKQKKSDAL